MSVEQLPQIISAVRAAPVFTDSFEGAPSLAATFDQIMGLASSLPDEMVEFFTPGTPEESERDVRRRVAGFVAESAAFCALLAPEQEDAPRRELALLVGGGYWADDLLESNDEAITPAIHLANGRDTAVPDGLDEAVAARLSMLKQADELAAGIARPEDVERVIFVGYNQSLTAQASIHDLSVRFYELRSAAAQQDFLAANAEKIAHDLVDGAGAPCAAVPLYAMFRKSDPNLPTLEEVYETEELKTLMTIGNVAVRAWDDRKDSEDDVDSTLNLYNQAHRAVVDKFLDMARVTDSEIRGKLTQAILGFSSDPGTNGALVADTLSEHLRQYVKNLPEPVKSRHGLFITLFKRTLEAAWVSGDPNID